MTSIQMQLLYQLFMNHAGPMMSSVFTSAYHVRSEVDDERELDLLQMDRMLKWMSLPFEDTVDKTKIEHRSYKQELYNIYVTIRSDFHQYQEWKRYNASLWAFSSYRNKNTKELARKILADVKLFKEGLEMFSQFEKL